MNRLLGVMFAFAVVFVTADLAEAQVYQVYYPAPVTTYYAPAQRPSLQLHLQRSITAPRLWPRRVTAR